MILLKSGLHRKFLAATVIGFAFWHGISSFVKRNDLHPFTYIGWLNEQLSISFIVILVGFFLAITTRTVLISQKTNLLAFLADCSLAVISMLIFMRYFWLSTAAFTLFGLLDAILISSTSSHLNPKLSIVLVVSSVSMFVAALCFIGTSFLGVGN